MSQQALTLKEAVDEYLVTVYRAHPHATYMAYRRALELFLTTVRKAFDIQPAREPVTSLDNEWAESFVVFLQKKHATETEHLYSRAVLDFYRHVLEMGWAVVNTGDLENYYADQRRPKNYAPPTPPIEAIDQLLAFVQTVAPPPAEAKLDRDHLRVLRDKAFLLTLADTGLRISESCALRLGQLSEDRRWLRLETPIPLSARAARALDAYLTERRPLDSAQTHLPADSLPIFARHDKRAGKRVLPISRWTGNNIVDFWVKMALPEQALSEALQRGQQITPQTFRHYFVVTTLTATGDPEATRQLARHAHPATTRRYVRSIRQEKEEGRSLDENE
jgi:integrase/recombinase XerC